MVVVTIVIDRVMHKLITFGGPTLYRFIALPAKLTRIGKKQFCNFEAEKIRFWAN